MSRPKVIASDLDGTLLYPRNPFQLANRKTVRFVRRYVEDGGKVILVTSRSAEFTDKVARFFKIPLNAICYSGARIYHEGELIHEEFLAPGVAERILEDTKDVTHIGLMYTKDRTMVYNRHNASPWANFCFWGFSFFLGEHREHCVAKPEVYAEELMKDRVYKLMMIVGFSEKKRERLQSLVADLSAKYPEVTIGWNGPALEVSPKKCTKADALSFYLDYTKIGRDNVLVVGDGGNDVPMFAAYPEMSYCLAHADEAVKGQAGHTIRRFLDLEKVIYPLEEKHSEERKKVTK